MMEGTTVCEDGKQRHVWYTVESTGLESEQAAQLSGPLSLLPVSPISKLVESIKWSTMNSGSLEILNC